MDSDSFELEVEIATTSDFSHLTSPVTPTHRSMESTPKKHHFRISMDLDLLKEVHAIYPFGVDRGQVAKAWDSVALNCGGKFDGNGGRKRCAKLLAAFKKEDLANIKKSGTDEQYNEIDQLLQDLSDRINDSGSSKESKNFKRKNGEADAAEVIRTAAMEGMSKVSKELKASKVKPNEINQTERQRLLSIMEDTAQVKRQKLVLEERRLELEEKRRVDEQRERDALIQALLALASRQN